MPGIRNRIGWRISIGGQQPAFKRDVVGISHRRHVPFRANSQARIGRFVDRERFCMKSFAPGAFSILLTLAVRGTIPRNCTGIFTVVHRRGISFARVWQTFFAVDGSGQHPSEHGRGSGTKTTFTTHPASKARCWRYGFSNDLFALAKPFVLSSQRDS